MGGTVKLEPTEHQLRFLKEFTGTTLSAEAVFDYVAGWALEAAAARLAMTPVHDHDMGKHAMLAHAVNLLRAMKP